ncbi:MAG: 50S ribosomal protein L1 [Thermoplasmata archaeon]|nr:50S ribosomal protein L1 [Thermoplasmata archaeon]NIS13925.1 50S ribosomal protein L1 [Thermoplasmata archaeon]NIS21767.1 50S ribosomal protein L1 [Thermoplasmata archaeon]NIT79363.1 50S ribosomal protein L1 [Thermoplasmata archaeon]NIU50800.1 50S ribosomal protein L1 [Thermoplasmata archaeon]
MDDRSVNEKVQEALEKAPPRKFSETIEIAVNLRDVDMSVPKNRINEEVILPRGRGKKQKIAVIGSGEMVLKAKGVADVVIQPDEIESIADDKRNARKIVRGIDFFIAEAPLMPVIGKRLGVFLGPPGKMPRPVPPGSDPSGLVDNLRNTVRVRSRDKNVVHVPVGTTTMKPEDVTTNILEIMRRIESKTPRGRGNIASVYVKTTMGPSVRLN